MSVWVNGRADLGLDLHDPLLLGAGTFTTLRTYGRRLWQIDAHLRRLHAGASWLGAPWSTDWLCEFDRLDAHIRATAGPEQKVHAILSASGARVLRSAPLDEHLVRRPVAARSATGPVGPPGAARHKLTTRALWGPGGEERLFTLNDRWLETDRGNIFVVRDGSLITAPDDGNILPGVTRELLLRIARAEGISVRIEAPARGATDALYVCSTLKELAPIVQLNGEARQAGEAIGDRLLQRWGELVESGTSPTRAAPESANRP